ncbi:MAG: hypothetical protein CM1200mP30_11290 [Pseudomonadota bacterium]|nr:MAG: hypothetical protein CM1200mP30_11290 [Pseudomonadota bacterium]
MAGLQFNLVDITKRFKLILVNGFGYLGLGTAVFFGARPQFAGTKGL